VYSSTCFSYQTQVTNKKPEMAKGGTDLGGVQICVNYGNLSSNTKTIDWRHNFLKSVELVMTVQEAIHRSFAKSHIIGIKSYVIPSRSSDTDDEVWCVAAGKMT